MKIAAWFTGINLGCGIVLNYLKWPNVNVRSSDLISVWEAYDVTAMWRHTDICWCMFDRWTDGVAFLIVSYTTTFRSRCVPLTIEYTPCRLVIRALFFNTDLRAPNPERFTYIPTSEWYSHETNSNWTRVSPATNCARSPMFRRIPSTRQRDSGLRIIYRKFYFIFNFASFTSVPGGAAILRYAKIVYLNDISFVRINLGNKLVHEFSFCLCRWVRVRCSYLNWLCNWLCNWIDCVIRPSE